MKKLLLLAFLCSSSVLANPVIYTCEEGYQVKYNLTNIKPNEGYLAVLKDGKQIASQDNVNFNDVSSSAITPNGDSVSNLTLYSYSKTPLPIGSIILSSIIKETDPLYIGDFIELSGHEFEDKGGVAILHFINFGDNSRTSFNCTRPAFRS